MPIAIGAQIRRMDEEEFKAVVYSAMQHVFAVHNEMGRLFDEKIYQREIARRMENSEREVPIEVSFEDFTKTYYVDLLVGNGAMFELKAVENLAERHRGQLLNYLFLAGLPHGKLVNLRPERVQHEFINAPLQLDDRTDFAIDDGDWAEIGGFRLKDKMVVMLRDWGAGLDLGLYQEAASHCCGRAAEPEAEIEIRMGNASLGTQAVRLASPEAALRVTCFPSDRHCASRLTSANFSRALRFVLFNGSISRAPWSDSRQSVNIFLSLIFLSCPATPNA